MKPKSWVVMTFLVLLCAGSANASNLNQNLLDGSLIPKFVDPLPVGVPDGTPGGITVVNATSGPLLNLSPTPNYNIHIREFQAQILPSGFMGPSWVWGYLTDQDQAAGGVRPSYLGPVVVAQRGVPAHPTYFNELPYPAGNVQMNLPVDMTLDWANPLGIDCTPVGDVLPPVCMSLPYTGPWPSAVHIHGGEVAPAYDGGPDAWVSPVGSGGPQGIGFPGHTYTYPNGQEEGTIWFHPHEFGVTRLGVYAGLAGAYPIVDPGGPSAPVATLPHFPEFDIPIIIQDRSFDTNGQLYYRLASNPQPNPSVHPYWIPEFIGDVICVNGKTWPYLKVEPRQYRFRLLNGSNARFYDLSLSNGAPFIAIATDDGYVLNAASVPNIIIGPGERYEVIVDFKNFGGREIVLMNAAGTPFPDGDSPSENGTDTVMKFIVGTSTSGIADTAIADGTRIRPTSLNPIRNAHNPAAGSITRQLTLNEVSLSGPLELVVNNSKYNLKSYDPANQSRANPVLPGCQSPLCRETELPAVGDTEIWEIINITADAHPMHTHLVSFQVLDRTPFNTDAPNTGSDWITRYEELLRSNGVPPGGGPPNQYNVKNSDGAIGGNPPLDGFLNVVARSGPLPYEKGWKDTVVTYPDEVTRIVVRWAPQDTPVDAVQAGQNKYPFNPTSLLNGIGYVWHCHILDHEDNEMMRNYTVMPARQPVVAREVSPDLNGDGCVDRADFNLINGVIRSRSPYDVRYDINQDGVVNIADARRLVVLFTNPGGVACVQ